jgi:hypothetical protein
MKSRAPGRYANCSSLRPFSLHTRLLPILALVVPHRGHQVLDLLVRHEDQIRALVSLRLQVLLEEPETFGERESRVLKTSS